ncbi:MAG: PaaI family thioesterase [Kiritimatiellae bacterium]|nr:PaaI family thioesterase [Kiritimatiellia bacterium]
MTIRSRQEMLIAMRRQYHNDCPICGPLNTRGMKLAFEACSQGAVKANIMCSADNESYTGHLHGGILASLLDGAMTSCLFSHGIAAVTGELTIRLLQPVCAGTSILARAWLERKRAPFYLVKGELKQDGILAARAQAKFIQKSKGQYP